MKKLFRTLLAATLIASGGHPRRFNTFQPLGASHSRVQLIGPAQPDLARLTLKDLRKLATTMQIKGRSKARRKADLVALIQKAGVK